MAPSNRPSTPLIFPFYLLSPLPFRRRTSSSSTSSNSSTTSPDAATSPTAAAPNHLSGHTSYLRCSRCSTHLCLTSQIISKGFTGRHGRAYLVSASSVPSISLSATSSSSLYSGANSLPNTHTHKAVPRQLVTGAHTVSDVSCVFCGSVLGWKYVAAEEESQRYKVGKFILETRRICSVSDWESGGIVMPPVELDGRAKTGVDEVVFDSQDEDECEDLFAGVWSPALAARRRRGRRFGRVGGSEGGERTRSED